MPLLAWDTPPFLLKLNKEGEGNREEKEETHLRIGTPRLILFMETRPRIRPRFVIFTGLVGLEYAPMQWASQRKQNSGIALQEKR